MLPTSNETNPSLLRSLIAKSMDSDHQNSNGLRAMAEARTSIDKAWHFQYEKLVEFQRKNSHCMVPFRYKQDKSLGPWVFAQRSFHANNKLQPDRKKLLIALKFIWNAQDHEWHLKYDKLVDFKRKNGHCIVPKIYEQDKSLGRWVGNQRRSHTERKVRLDRKELLDELGFVWRITNLGDKTWREQNKKRIEIKQSSGDCIGVPQGDKSPGKWDTTQSTLSVRRSLSTTDDDLDSESDAFSRSVGLSNKTLKETGPAKCHERHRLECTSPANIKRPRIYLAESGQIMAATRTSREGNAADSCCSVETDTGHDEEDPKPSLVSSRNVLVRSDPDEDFVQEEATPDVIPAGWTRTKLEPDW